MTKHATTRNRQYKVRQFVNLLNKYSRQLKPVELQWIPLYRLMFDLLDIKKCQGKGCSNWMPPRKGRRYCSGSCKTASYRERRDGKLVQKIKELESEIKELESAGEIPCKK